MSETNRIYDGVEAETRKSQVSFQNIQSYARLAEHKTNDLKPSLGFPCRGLNSIIDYFLTHYIYETEMPFSAKTYVQAITIYFRLVLTC